MAVLLGPLLLAACGGAGQSAQTLQNRLDASLSREQAQHQAAVRPLADGAQVEFDESSLFLAGQSDLSPSGKYAIASFAEAMLAPSLMEISVAGSSQTADYLRTQRAQSVQNYVQAYSLSPLPVSTTEPVVTPSNTSAQGMTIVVHVRCPPGPQGTTWGYPPERPTCN
jgi:flagellar motor protein MotB